LTPHERVEIDQLLNNRAISFEEFLPRTAPASWVWQWPHQRAIYSYLNAVTDGEITKLIISMPPRHTKTETITVRYPVYRMYRDATTRTAIGCYNQIQANKYSRKARQAARAVGIALSQERSATEEWETEQHGGMMARGVGSGVTGNGYDLIVIDDPVKSRAEAESPAFRDAVWDWYRDDLYTRLEPGGAIIVVMTRWHEDDLVGRILASDDAANWTVVNLPAIAEENDPMGRTPGEALCPDRFPLDVLLDRKRVLGPYSFNALYQGHPSPPEGSLLQRSWWKYYTMLPSRFEAIFASWDCTFKDADDSDFVVGQVWGRLGADYYLLDQTRGRMGFVATRQAIKAQKAKWPLIRALYIEDKANGTAVIETLKHEISGIIPVNPEGGKIARVQAISPMIEAGNVYLPEKASFVGDFVEECAAFPNAAHDDQVDAMSQALFHGNQYRPPQLAAGGQRKAVTEYVPR
jgi:predicted phage terminase large subunit-like protein